MRFWFSRANSTPIREQLAVQVMLGIVSGDLVPGQRLPSTRELARRFSIHANTISAAYRQLEREHWVESRKGSGVYVKERRPPAPVTPAGALDPLITQLFRSARELGVPLAELRSGLKLRLAAPPPARFLVIEPDRDLRDILIAEMSRVLSFPVIGCGMDILRQPAKLTGCVAVVLPSKREAVEPLLPSGTECVTLNVTSVPISLAAYLPAPSHALIGVASRWPDFLTSAKTMLSAAGFDADQLLVRDARKTGWLRALDQTAAVVCDCVTAAELPKSCRAIPFPLLSEASIAELRRYQDYLLPL